jgi:dolichyl-phosphooligosaccharide-protein glycotransferase
LSNDNSEKEVVNQESSSDNSVKSSQEIEKEVNTLEKETQEKAEEIKEEIDTTIKKEEKELKIEEKKEDFLKKDISKLEEEKEKLDKFSDDDKEISLDLSNVKNKITGLFKKLTSKKTEKPKEKSSRTKEIFATEDKNDKKRSKKKRSEDISFNIGKVFSFGKKNSTWLIPLVLILVVIMTSTYFRAMPASLPITEEWAENTVYNFYEEQITTGIAQQYPNLPQQNRKLLVEKELDKFFKENKESVNNDIKQISKQYKESFQDDDGQTYLLAIDPYHWYSMAKNYEENGHFGDGISEEGVSTFSLRNGREGKNLGVQPFNSLVMVILHRAMSIFSNVSLMTAAFYLPLILIALSIIPAFFITRKIGGNWGGFFAGMIIAINAALLGRTPAGFADTDAYSILFPLLIVWLLLESFDAKSLKSKLTLASLSGLATGLFSFAWRGWWYMFDFILAGIVIYILYLLYLNRKDIKNVFNNSKFKSTMIICLGYIVSSGIFVTIFLKKFEKFYTAPLQPLDVITIKDVATNKIWPNVLTTVAEFNEVAFKKIFVQMGGELLFFIAIIGLLIAFTTSFYSKIKERKELIYPLILLFWLVGTMYSFTKGIRFAILMVPVFAITFGIALGFVYTYVVRWVKKNLYINKLVIQIVVIAILMLLLISPLKAAADVGRGELPSMDDAWYNTLTKIKDNTNDAIITSWWDFGHWFYAISERRVTFDGADQGERIHWVGKTLLTSNEKTSVGILRMLNCGQERPVHLLEEFFADDTLRAVNVLNAMMVLNDKNKAIAILKEEGLTNEQIAEIIKITYCEDLIEQFFITSEDMVGKAGVWGHFGSWDFERAAMYQAVINNKVEGRQILIDEYGLTEEKADEYYYEITTTPGDQWVTTWPGFQGSGKCTKVDEQTLNCNVNLGQQGTATLEVDLTTMNAEIETNKNPIHPNSIVYATENRVEERKFEDDLLGLSVVLLPEQNKIILTHPLQANSIFTKLFYFEGHGLDCFSKFDERNQVTGGRIVTWKIDWNCQQENNIFGSVLESTPEPESSEESTGSE